MMNLLCLTLAATQVALPSMPWQGQSIPFTEKCVTDSYTICVPIANNGVTERLTLSGESKTKFHVEQVRVIDFQLLEKESHYRHPYSLAKNRLSCRFLTSRTADTARRFRANSKQIA
jgi:hypothetical protein